jgi:hypothetical protein
MSRLSHVCYLILTAGMFLAGVQLCENSLCAQGADSQAVNIVTVDGVKIKGYFYAGKATAPTVIMLHPVGEGKSIKSQDWKRLATTLNQKGAGYSVMMFDFRGHGDSTSVDPDLFWTEPFNKKLVKSKVKDEIDVKEYIKSPMYLPVLVNDIAAVKAYLDRLHDKGTCNTSNTIVIGADNGATLGAIWINSEWNRYRYKVTPSAVVGGKPKVTVDKNAEGMDIIAAVFLTISPDLSATRKVNVPNILANACKVRGMGATFFYGENDAKAKDFANMLESKLKPKDKEGKTAKKYDFIGTVKMPKTNLSGMKLLQESLETDKTILEYLDGVVADRSNEYIERDSQNATYIWQLSPKTPPISAKKNKGDKNLNFNDYNQFIPQ